MKKYKLENPIEYDDLTFSHIQVDSYYMPHNPALTLIADIPEGESTDEYDDEDGFYDIIISTNIRPLPDNHFALNTNLHSISILKKQLLETNLFVDTENIIPSGFCTYPVYSFDFSTLTQVE